MTKLNTLVVVGGMFCIEVEIMETLNNIAATFEELKKKKKYHTPLCLCESYQLRMLLQLWTGQQFNKRVHIP